MQLSLEHMETYRLLFGLNDRNMAALEQEMEVSVSLRGNELIVRGEGENVQLAERVIEKLIEMLKKGEMIDASRIRYAVALAREKGMQAAVVTFENGVLTATGVGSTNVVARYGYKYITCQVSCLAETQEDLNALPEEILAPKFGGYACIAVVDGKIAPCIFNMALKQGVTTVVGGNCGSNETAPDTYLDAVDRIGAPGNLALMAGHSFLRRAAGGWDKYAPIDDQAIEKMAEMFGKSLDIHRAMG